VQFKGLLRKNPSGTANFVEKAGDINGSSSKRATTSGIIQLQDKLYYTTAAHATSFQVRIDSEVSVESDEEIGLDSEGDSDIEDPGLSCLCWS
jgi:peptide-N4-(N-acetyl-beta-glucosaminyl)asparagine amidase